MALSPFYWTTTLWGRQLQVQSSPDPATTAFNTIDTLTKNPLSAYLEQPWIRAVTVGNVDHIFMAYNNPGAYLGRTAKVHYSLNSGSTWKDKIVEKVNPGAGWDSPGVRLALSSDGKTVYALFRRASSWTGTAFQSDFIGDVVLVRDDNYGDSGFNDLGTGGTGALVLNNDYLPYATSLGAQKLFSGGCDVAVQPYRNNKVYVAFTLLLGVNHDNPNIVVARSTDSGQSFQNSDVIDHASVPALAVASDGTLGLLYLKKNGGNLEVHFKKYFFGDFLNPHNVTDQTLAWFENNIPQSEHDPYLGDYFSLRTVGRNFFGAFCASNEPIPDHFPSGVFYQRNVRYIDPITQQHIIKTNFTLSQVGGELVPPNDAFIVSRSIDPFVFYDIPGFEVSPRLDYFPGALTLVGDPLSGTDHLSWPMLPSSEPQFELQTADTLGPDTHWTVATAAQGVSIIQTNGQNFATFVGPDSQRFFRLQQSLAGSQFLLFAGTGAHGSLAVAPGGGVVGPDGVMTNAALSSPTFIATPTNGYYVDKWYLDGVAVQSITPSLTVSNIASEHTLVVTFSPSNDLALTLFESSGVHLPTETGNTNTYVVEIENKGLNPLTGVSMMNMLDPTVGFVSATTSQGTVAYIGGQVIANIGSLNPGDLVTVNIQFIPFFAATILDTANVVCDQPEPDLSNNSATVSTTVIDPVVITSQPVSTNAPPGGTATFSVGVTGTPPFTYEWFFNGTNLLDGATSATLTLTNVTATQAGTYAVSVLQVFGPEEIEADNSLPATLTVP
jgi:uncharacterized repeat protein (TIGR01451 family)